MNRPGLQDYLKGLEVGHRGRQITLVEMIEENHQEGNSEEAEGGENRHLLLIEAEVQQEDQVVHLLDHLLYHLQGLLLLGIEDLKG